MRNIQYRKRRLLASSLLLIIALMFSASFSVFAAPTMSLDELVGNNENTETAVVETAPVETAPVESAPVQSEPVQSTPVESAPAQSTQAANNAGGTVSGDVYNNIADASRVDLDNPKAASATAGLKNIVGVIISFLSYAIVIGMTLRVILDLLYVCIPFTRRFLCADPQANVQGMNGMGAMGSMGTMGAMGGGFGGGYGSRFGGGYGAGGYGGMGSMGMGAPGAMGAQAQQAQGGVGIGGIQWISKAAQNAVAMEGAPDPATGAPSKPLKMYAKDMILLLIAVPILIVLATSGTLVDLGFGIASAITKLIGQISNSF